VSGDLSITDCQAVDVEVDSASVNVEAAHSLAASLVVSPDVPADLFIAADHIVDVQVESVPLGVEVEDAVTASVVVLGKGDKGDPGERGERGEPGPEGPPGNILGDVDGGAANTVFADFIDGGSA